MIILVLKNIFFTINILNRRKKERMDDPLKLNKRIFSSNQFNIRSSSENKPYLYKQKSHHLQQ